MTFIVIFFILSVSAMFILLVNSNLKRRNANLQHIGGNQRNANIESINNVDSERDYKKTRVTTAKF